MPVYGLGYGLGRIGAGLPEAIQQGQQNRMSLEQQAIELENRRNALQEYQGLQQAAQQAVNPSTGQLDTGKYLSLVAQNAPTHYPQISNNINLTNYRQQQGELKGAQADLTRQKAQGLASDADNAELARILLDIQNITDPDPQIQLGKRHEAYKIAIPKLQKIGSGQILPDELQGQLTDDFLDRAWKSTGLSFKDFARVQTAERGQDIRKKLGEERNAIINRHNIAMEQLRRISGGTTGGGSGLTVRQKDVAGYVQAQLALRPDADPKKVAVEAWDKFRPYGGGGEGLRVSKSLIDAGNKWLARLNGIYGSKKFASHSPEAMEEYRQAEELFQSGLNSLQSIEDQPKDQPKTQSTPKGVAPLPPGAVIVR